MKVVEDFIAFILKLGGGATHIEQYVADFKAFLLVLVTNDSAQIVIQIGNIVVTQEKLCKSQLALENFVNDEQLKNDPEFSDFYTAYDEFLAEIESIKLNTGLALEHFTTKVKDRCAKLMILMISCSKKAAIKKGLLSE